MRMYKNLAEARKTGTTFLYLESEIKKSARIVLTYYKMNEPKTKSLDAELLRYSDLMVRINSLYPIEGHKIFFNWETMRLNLKRIESNVRS